MTNAPLEGGRGLVDEGRVGDWMQTWTGKRFYIADPRPADVDILDIAFALGNMTRYGGHCRFYSVAEHSVLVSRIVPPEDAFAGLMHDAHEAYVADMIRPMKRTLKQMGQYDWYHALELGVWHAVADAYGIAHELPESVKVADGYRMIVLEKEVLHPRSDAWELGGHEPPDVKIEYWDPDRATRMFLRRFVTLLPPSRMTIQEVDRMWDYYSHLVMTDAVALAAHRQA